jgi:hypothetical protein
MMKSFESLGGWALKRLRAFLALGVMLAALPAAALPSATLAAEDSPLCSAGATWVDMDDPERHPAALDRAALGLYDANGDAQLWLHLTPAAGASSLRVGYTLFDLDARKEAGSTANCPKDSGPVDMNRPDTMPFP